MANNKYELKTALFEDGTYAVLRVDVSSPRVVEVIGTFYDKAHAKHFVGLHSAPAETAHSEKRAPATGNARRKPAKAAASEPVRSGKASPVQTVARVSKPAVKAAPKHTSAALTKKPAAQVNSKNGAADLSDRQLSVLKALRTLMDKKHRVEVKAAELAKASSVPLGSLHSVLTSLEKKHMIRTERQGSPKFSAIYEVLSTAAKSARPLNGVAHGKSPSAPLAR
jgi:DNA-binding transcriptional ArsR family regulator